MIKRLSINLLCAAVVITVLYAMVVGAQLGMEALFHPLTNTPK